MGRESAHKVLVTMSDEEYETLCHWAKVAGVSHNQYLRDALAYKERWDAGDYDLPTAEQARLLQIHDVMESINSNVGQLMDIVIRQTETITNLTTGENYLADVDDVDDVDDE